MTGNRNSFPMVAEEGQRPSASACATRALPPCFLSRRSSPDVAAGTNRPNLRPGTLSQSPYAAIRGPAPGRLPLALATLVTAIAITAHGAKAGWATGPLIVVPLLTLIVGAVLLMTAKESAL